jgi:hypothetical protein
MVDLNRDDDSSLDSVPDDLRAEYFWYLQEANSERTLSGKAWMAWRQSGCGKAEQFLQTETNKEMERMD